ALMLRAMAVSAVVAFAILALAAASWRLWAHQLGRSVGGDRGRLVAVLSVGLGFLAGGLLLLGTTARWAPGEDQDRLLLVLLPTVLLVECVAALRPVRTWMAWTLRLLVAAVAARILLHGSSYITDLSGPGSSTWTQGRQILVFGGLAGLLAV